jgi:glucose-6-phosphate isomerase
VAARSSLEGEPDSTPPPFVDGPVEVRVLGGDWADGAKSLAEAVDALFGRLDPERGYVAIMAYLDRLRHADLAKVRRPVAARTGRPTTFGWGPRFLHSTGQLHKGGPAVGVYLQVTGDSGDDLAVPGRDYTFGRLIAAQAAGDAQVLAEHGRPVLRVHLTDVPAGLDALREALDGR